MKRTMLLTVTLACLAALPRLGAHEPVTRARTDVQIPEIPGYVTLKCDFHMHTVFSDGLVWPTVRVEEAWRQGLDVISITDHIEYQPHKADVSTNHNRSYEIARGSGSGLDILVIKGSEITRKMPPGHLNAIFLTNSALLAVTNWRDAVAEADRQGAFIFWNHPGWDAQTTNGIVRWYDEHTELLAQQRLHGIEVVNGRDYYPEAHQWALEKKLALFSNSDVHNPLNLDYHTHQGDHRPITLVFARDRTPEAIKKALFDRQTAAYSGEWLIGDEAFLRPIFERSIRLNTSKLAIKGKQRLAVQIRNESEIDYRLELDQESPEVSAPKKITLPGRKTVLFDVQGKSASAKGRKTLDLRYRVANLLVAPEKPLVVPIRLDISFTPSATK